MKRHEYFRHLLVAVLAFRVLFAVCNSRADDAYTSWVRPWLERPVASPVFAGRNLKLIVSRVKGEAEIAAITNMTPVKRLQLSYRLEVFAVELAADGRLRTYFVSNTDASSSSVRQMAAADFQRLDSLLNQLPDDDSKLPPAGNRIVVQHLDGDRWRVRVYDGKNLPPEVKNLMTLLAKPAKNLF
jgi:hypothetical protein